MRLAHPLLLASVAAVSLAGAAFGQNAISAKAGMINVAEGDVFLVDAKGGEKLVQPKPAEFVEVKEGQTLRAAEGRVEVLLTPGSFLRMADSSSFKLFSNRLNDVRLDVTSGVVMIEAAELLEDNHITVLTKDAAVVLTKAGLYRVEAEPAGVRVYTGEAVVDVNGQKTTLKGGRELVATAGGWAPGKFDAKETDPLYRWAKRRSGYIAMANVSAARQSTGYRPGFMNSGMWTYNPYFGFATFIPYMDTLRSPFGFYYYTPGTVMAVYYPAIYGGGGGGRGSYARTGNGFTASAPGRTASASSFAAGPSMAGPSAFASSSGISRGSGSMASMGGGGGGSVSAPSGGTASAAGSGGGSGRGR